MTPGSHRRSHRIFLSATFLAGVAAASLLAAQERPTFPSGIELVKVDVVVVGRDGKPVRGLTREDFHVFDEGRERPVVSFEAVVPPAPVAEVTARPQRVSTNVGESVPAPKALLLFVFDGMRPSPAGRHRATKVLREFVEASPDLDADVALASTDSQQTWTGRTRDLRAPADFDQAILAALGPPASTGANLDPKGLNPGIVPVVSRTYDMGTMAEKTRSAALTNLIEHFAAGRPGRTTMILLSEGVIVWAGDARTKDVALPAARNRVVIYGLDIRGLTAPLTGVDHATLWDTDGSGARARVTMDSSRSWAEDLARATGGRNVRGTENLGVALAGFVEESLSYYLLGFEPDAGASPGDMRSLKVKLAQKGYDVRARPAYVVPHPGERPTSSPPVGQPLPLHVAAFVGGPTSEGRSSVRVVLEVDPGSLVTAPGDGRVTLESQIDLVPKGGGEARKLEHRSDVKLTPDLRRSLGRGWLPLARDVDLSPGIYQARVVVRDAGTGRSGAVTHVFEVPGTGALRLTTPVVSDLFRPDGSAREIARVRFDPAREVECAFEVLGGAQALGGPGHLQASWSLRSAAGEEVDSGEPEGSGESRARFTFRIPLADLADGPYTLSLAVRDDTSGATAEDEETVEVARIAAVQ